MSPKWNPRLALSFLVVLLALSPMSAQIAPTLLNKPPSGGGTPTMEYHGGPVMTANPINTYIIWYGNWNAAGSDTPYTQALIEHFLSTFGGTQLMLVNTGYSDATGAVSGNVAFGGSITNTSTKNLNNIAIKKVVTNALSSGALPTDANAVYFVLTSSDVNETSGFCSSYCGWHDHATINGADIKYAFVGNPDRCASSCEIQTTGPNSPAVGVGGADGMANVMTHELSESVTDPDLDAWFDTSSGDENADLCNYNFGIHNLCGTGGLCTAAGNYTAADYNQTFGNNNWMLQMLWENTTPGACVQHL
ncbi:MAG TPA: hypothetical protein VLT16_00270 [Candidatus Limnocylindrales bacterium]|nr:hypothetical protein [Candidatus Limnocylindrales bacterium]